MGETERAIERNRALKSYLGWSDEDARRVAAIAGVMVPRLPAMIDDFYEEIQRHAEAAAVITGGEEQVDRLKQSLRRWLDEMLRCPPDDAYAERCWRVGRRHAEIGLDPVFVIAAFSRLRSGFLRAIQTSWHGTQHERAETLQAVNRRLDLDMGLIEDAYQAEYGARLQRAERLATLGQVAGGLAHELRNPLNVVKTSVYYLRHARSPSPEKQADHLSRIGRGVDRADAVITALSDFAKMSMPHTCPTSLCVSIQEAIEANPPGESITTERDCPPGLSVQVDPRQLQIVLANLIRNANDAMPGGGTLSIRAQEVEDRRVALSVTDTGVGIDPAIAEKITQPLFSTKPHGLGIGLAIARAIVEKNGGALRIASEPGRGSTFTLFLPAAEVTGGQQP